MPNVTHEASMLTTGGLMGKQRQYLLVHTPTGAAVAVYIGQFGRDPYLAWDLFIRPVVNWVIVGGTAGLAALLGLMGSCAPNSFTGRSSFSLGGWIVGTVGLAILFAFIIAAAGAFLRRNPLAFFFKQLDFFDADDISAMSLAVHKSLLQAADAVGIDMQLLRTKQQFQGGRRDRLI